MSANIIYENNCPTFKGANCATFMMKSINISTHDNIVADQNYSQIFELSPYRMPAANMDVSRNILWNTTQRKYDTVADMRGGISPFAYTASCLIPWDHTLSPQNATLGDLLSSGDGTNDQRSAESQYGFSEEQLDWPVVHSADGNFVSDPEYLKAHGCDRWDRHSIELSTRPFVETGTPWHSRTALDYAVSPDSPLVTNHGFRGSFNVSHIGLTDDFALQAISEYKRRDAYSILQAERYDRTSNLWTLEAHGLGTGTGSHFQKDPAYSTPPGSWARFDAVDFGTCGALVTVTAFAQASLVGDGATVRFQLGAPDDSGGLLSTVKISSSTTSFALHNGTVGTDIAPRGIHAVFMVFDINDDSQQIGAIVDWFSFRCDRGAA